MPKGRMLCDISSFVIDFHILLHMLDDQKKPYFMRDG